MANLRDLADLMIGLSKSTDQLSSDLSVKIATAIITDLVYVTPVDTSKALSNWQISLSNAGSGQLPAAYRGFKGSTANVSAESTLAFALAILKTKKPNQNIHIYNNLPYIRRLNEGYSSQAPAGFVERAELIGRKVIEQESNLNVR